MIVEVDTAKIAALEDRVQTLAAMLTAICSTRPKGVRITDAMLAKGGGVRVVTDATKNETVLTYVPPESP